MVPGPRRPAKDVDGHTATEGSLSAWSVDVKAQPRTASNADAMNRQHRKPLRKAVKEVGINLEDEAKNPDKTGQIRPNPGKSG